MNTNMMKHVWPQGYLNMLYVSIFVVGVMLAINWSVMFVTKRPHLDTMVISTLVLFSFAMMHHLWSSLRGIKHRGKMLLDCGYHPIRKQSHIQAAVFFVIGVIASLLMFHDAIFRWSALFGMMIAGWFYSIGQGRLAIHENGVWSYWGLIKWNRIKEYSWTDDGSLKVLMTGPIEAIRKGVIVVPPEHTEEFSQMFKQQMT